MRQRDVAEMLGMTESWVEQIRLRGGGPVYHKIGKSVRYRIEDVLAWIDGQKRCSTSQFA
ncbi:helix-turn-helix transcriptional regulator [Geomonas limicola]|uniref:helix-turn-helix transcriptional regulator n=1 Tax=Geomonas limicola TaxID=2740186 RepID=UPI003530A3EF